MNRLRNFARASFLSILTGAALLRVVTSCAAGDPNPAPVVQPAPDAEATVIPGPDAAPPSFCGDGWCAVTIPSTTPVALNGVWGSGPNDVWIVGSPDLTTVHWDGAQLTSSTAPQNRALFGVWGTGANDVWAFNAGDALWHSAGHTAGDAGWSRSSVVDPDAGPAWTGMISAMWGRSASDVWAVGSPSMIGPGFPSVWHCDGWHDGGVEWVAAPSMPDRPDIPGGFAFNAIWGDATSDIWIVGNRGKTRYTDGWKGDSTTFTAINSATTFDLYAVWGTAQGDVWAAGAGGVVRRFSRQTDGTYLVSSVDFPTQATIRSLFGFAPDDIWAAGSAGTLAHWDGHAWSLVALPMADSGANDLFAIWGASPDDIWVVGQNTLLHKGSIVLPGTSR